MTISKDILVAAVERYVTNTASSLFGISSIPAQALMKYAVRNIADKYSMVFDLFSNKNGLIESDLLINALRAEVKTRGGVKFMNIRFTEADIDEFRNILTQINGQQSSTTNTV